MTPIGHYKIRDTGPVIEFPGVRWGKHWRLTVHGRQGKIISVKVPGHNAYLNRGSGSVYCPAEFIVIETYTEPDEYGYQDARPVIKFPQREP